MFHYNFSAQIKLPLSNHSSRVKIKHSSYSAVLQSYTFSVSDYLCYCLHLIFLKQSQLWEKFDKYKMGNDQCFYGRKPCKLGTLGPLRKLGRLEDLKYSQINHHWIKFFISIVWKKKWRKKIILIFRNPLVRNVLKYVSNINIVFMGPPWGNG